MAFYLNRSLSDIAQVVAIPVSGSEIYLVKQMRWLNKSKPYYDIQDCNNENPNINGSKASNTSDMEMISLPDILRPRLRGSFADVRSDKLKIWKELSRATKEEFAFDLIYAPKAWEEVMFAIDQKRIGQEGQDILYYHTGGVEGNVSMMGKF